MRVYVSGAMTGRPGLNYPEFNRVAALLKDAGYDVVNPAAFDDARIDLPRDYCMRRDIKALLECDAIALLDDWGESKGAKLEVAVAEECGMKVRSYQYWLVKAKSKTGRK